MSESVHHHYEPIELHRLDQAAPIRLCSSCGQSMDTPGCCTSPESKIEYPQGFHTFNGGCGSNG